MSSVTIARTLGLFPLVLLLSVAPSFPANQPAPPGDAETPTAAKTPAEIPIAEIGPQAEAAKIELGQMSRALDVDLVSSRVATALTSLSRELDTGLRENMRALAQHPSLDELRTMGTTWAGHRRTLALWNRELAGRSVKLDRYLERLGNLGQTWQATLALAQREQAGPDLLLPVQALVGEVAQVRAEAQKQRAQLDTLQSRVAAQDFRAVDVIESIRDTQDTLLSHIFQQDAPRIWEAGRDDGGMDVAQQTGSASAAHADALGAYVVSHWGRFVLHLVCFAAIAFAMHSARRALRRRGQDDPWLREAEPVFSAPTSSGWLLALLLTPWLYADAPRALFLLVAAVAAVPAVLVLRPVTPGYLMPLLYALACLFVVDQFRALASAIPVLPRLVLLLEMMGGFVFLVWYTRRDGPAGQLKTADGAPQHKRVAAGAVVVLAFFAVTSVANIIGYLSLADLLGTAVLGSAYVAVALFAAVQIFDALLVIALRVRPLNRLAMVEHHTNTVRRHTRNVVAFAATVVWLSYALDRLAVRSRTLTAARAVLDSGIDIGSLHVTLGNLLALLIAMWAAFAVSRIVRFMLEEEIYPHARLSRGVPYAISRTVHYLIVLMGFFVGMGALGVDMTEFTILASAFTVGVGFGLQQIFNNFVSGLILLFERPVKVGDVIEMAGATGVVERIGIRASVLRTSTGSEVIVPNGKLIQEQLVNWTLSERQRGIEVNVNVAASADPRTVITTLEAIAAADPNVLEDPPPRALLKKVGDPLGFTLTAYTGRADDWLQVTSEISAAIPAAFARENIPLK